MKEEWILTLKGLIDDGVIYNEILLYMYKNNYNGIVLEDGILKFINLEPNKKKKRGEK